MAMYEEPIFGRNKSSHPGVDDLSMNTVTVLGDPSPFPAASFDFFILTHHGQFPRSEDERMVTPRCKRNPRRPTGPKHIRLLGFASSQRWTTGRRRGHDSSDDYEDSAPRITTTLKMTLWRLKRRGRYHSKCGSEEQLFQSSPNHWRQARKNMLKATLI